ncbi:MAG: VWA domain-containing protein [Bryobacteraceae bacterium]
MPRPASVISGIVLWLLATSAAAQEPPLFRVDVRLVRVLATVRDPAGELVGSLSRDDFSIFDNGAKQEIAVFERQTEQPLSIALLVDTSLSTAKEIRYTTESVSRFLKAVFSEGNPLDTVALYTFSYEVTLHSSFTRRRERLEEAMKGLKASSGTSLYDAIYLSSKDLELREGRRVVVLVTDGGDTTSAKRFRDALEAVQLADAVLYAILVVPITNEAGRNLGGENALASLASGTAGRVFTPSVGPDLDKAFSDILQELRTQYFLGYYPRGAPTGVDRFHRLEVRVAKLGLRVVARSGYYGEVEAHTPVSGPDRGPVVKKATPGNR